MMDQEMFCPAPEVAVFGYAFSHRKTCDMIVKLVTLGIRVKCVFAAPKIELDIPKPVHKIKLRHSEGIHPLWLCRALDIDYYETGHNNKSFIEKAVKKYNVNLGIIAGARILDSDVIDLFKHGIINLHNGILPKNRGLDCVLHAVMHDLPQGVTAHLIDGKIDAGKILYIKELKLYHDDTILDVQERLIEEEINIIDKAVWLAINDQAYVSEDPLGAYHSRMDKFGEHHVLMRWGSYLKAQLGGK